MPFVDEIWIPPQHQNSAHYVKVFHGTDAQVRTVPYLWSPFFLDEDAGEKSLKFNPKRKPQVLILEPNQNASKTCLIPLMVCERFNQAFPHACTSFSFFNTKNLKGNPTFERLIKQFQVTRDGHLFLNNKWKTVDAIDRIGQFILSHQTDNELNYLYFESLYLDLPLIHNSDRIKGFGYYYPENDILTASNQIYNAMINHKDNLDEYRRQNRLLIDKHSPLAPENIKFYNHIFSQMQ